MLSWPWFREEWNVYRNENDQKAGKQVFLKFFSVENRLRAFPKRENAFLALIQGRGYVYRNENDQNFAGK
jgi:hypothetical protein